MSGFEDVTLEWSGEKYTIPANRQLMLIATVEAALVGNTGKQAIELLLQPNGPPHAHLAMAFEAALRYAGAQIAEGEVYLSVMKDLANGSGDGIAKLNAATIAMLSIISPPIGSAMREDATPKKKGESKD